MTRPLRDVRFTDSVLRMLDARPRRSAPRQHLASEADFYGRRFASGVVCPPLRAGLPGHRPHVYAGLAAGSGDLEQDDRVDRERDREADRPAVQVALDERAAAERALAGADAEGAREPASLPECMSTRKIRTTQMTTWMMREEQFHRRSDLAAPRRARRSASMRAQDLDGLRAQLAVDLAPVGLGELAGAPVELGLADLAVLRLLGRLEVGAPRRPRPRRRRRRPRAAAR